jgi:uncharacterized membrane protein (UPF0127 family)
MIHRETICLAAILLTAVGCNSNGGQSLPTTTMQVGARRVTLEMALTDLQQKKGLMECDPPAHDRGMIFPFSNEKVLNFWNHNVRFPLDVIFCDHSGRVVSIVQMKAYNDDSVGSTYPAKYAIELVAGNAADLGVKPGDQLSIPAEVVAK